MDQTQKWRLLQFSFKRCTSLHFQVSTKKNHPTGKNAISPKTIKNVHGILHHALKKATQIHYIKENPADNCNLPRVEKKEIDFLSGDELASFLKTIRGHKYERMFVLAVFTGMRQGEILGLCWDAVDLKQGTIKVKRQLQLVKGEYVIQKW